MIRLRSALTAALLLAGLPAHAQGAEPRYRVLNVFSQGVHFVSTEVTGPQTLRSLTEVIVPRQAGPGGENLFVVTYTFDCVAGRLEMGEIATYRGAERVGTAPGDGRGMVKPVSDTSSTRMLSYACTGKLDSGDATVLTGLPAVFAFARQKLGL